MLVAKGNLIMNIQPCFKSMYERQGWVEVVDEPINDTNDCNQNIAHENSELRDGFLNNTEEQIKIEIDGKEIAKAVGKKPSRRSNKK